MITLDVPNGTYVVAVSGGVDSVALLHLLAELQYDESQVRKYDQDHYAQERDAVSRGDIKNWIPDRVGNDGGAKHNFIVAHFDHGIRADSEDDRRHVQRLAQHYGLPFAYERVELGPGASEAAARAARYKFLHELRRASGAQAIITAHHEDDAIETALLNLVRGTGSRGLHSLRSRQHVLRPLLGVPKKDLLRYAQTNGLVWREDSTNANTAILRNYLRHRIVTDMAKTHRSMLLKRSRRAAELNAEIDTIIANYLHLQPALDVLNRASFIELPHAVAREVLAAWLRRSAAGVELNRKLLERLVVSAKVGRSGSRIDVAAGYRLNLSPGAITLQDIMS